MTSTQFKKSWIP